MSMSVTITERVSALASPAAEIAVSTGIAYIITKGAAVAGLNPIWAIAYTAGACAISILITLGAEKFTSGKWKEIAMHLRPIVIFSAGLFGSKLYIGRIMLMRNAFMLFAIYTLAHTIFSVAKTAISSLPNRQEITTTFRSSFASISGLVTGGSSSSKTKTGN